VRRRSFAAHLFAWQLLLLIVVLFGMAIALDRVLEHAFVDDLTRSLVSQARTIQRALPGDEAVLQEAVRQLGQAGGVRVTVVRTDGVVLADSEHDPATMENHADRPEIRQALSGSVGTASRVSATLGQAFRYVALPPVDGRIVRVALPLTQVASRQRTVRISIVAGLLLAAAALTLGTLILSRRVTRSLRRATDSVERLGAGDFGERLDEGGPAEMAVLASTVNRMAAALDHQMKETGEARRVRDLILSSMEEGILLVAPDGHITFANPASERHLGSVPANASSLSPALLRSAVTSAQTDGTPTSIDVEVGMPPRALRGVATAVAADRSVLVVVRDVTEAKRLDSIRRDFVTNASHELKTPAAAIQAVAETIRGAARDDPGVIPRFAEQLENEAIRLSRIVSDLLDLSRLESGSELVQVVRLDDIAREETARLEPAASEAGLTLSVDLHPAEGVRGSARDLSLLVRNLVDNAIRWTRPGGTISVSVGSSDGETRLEVSDTGIGIPSRDLPRIFERFYRVDRARSRDTGGTGLGLSIVRHVAENHGGHVSVESELGRGTSFEVRLPAANAGP
jgi:two-component system phosphate regulon sensor histidine kinase PhoR